MMPLSAPCLVIYTVPAAEASDDVRATFRENRRANSNVQHASSLHRLEARTWHMFISDDTDSASLS
jgi:hypothetical protein